MAIASLVLGILGCIGVFFSWSPLCFLFLVLSIVGLVMAVMSRRATGSGLATAGLVTSIIGIAFAAVGSLCYLACYMAAEDIASELDNLNNLPF